MIDAAQAAAALARARAVHPALPERAPDEESRERMAAILEHARAAAAPPEREPGCDDGDEEASTSTPESGEFTSLQISQPAAPLHAPHVCRRCSQPVYWAALLDETGKRIPRDDGKGWKPVCVDAQPDPDGTVLLAHRPGEGIVARVVRPGELPPGARLRRRHPYPCCNGGRRG